jgi:hypothetical protein
MKEDLETFSTTLDIVNSENIYKTCLLAVPDLEDYEMVVKAMRLALSDLYGWRLIQPDDSLLVVNITDNLKSHIEKADFYMADISNLDPDVMWQAGLMTGSSSFKKPLIYLCRNDRKADIQQTSRSLQGVLAIIYDYAENSDLKKLTNYFSCQIRKRCEILSHLNISQSSHYICPEFLVHNELCSDKIADKICMHYFSVESLLDETPARILQKIRSQTHLGIIESIQSFLREHYDIYKCDDPAG